MVCGKEARAVLAAISCGGREVGRMSLPRFEPVRTKKSFIFLVVAGGKVRIGSATLLPSEESV